MSISILELVSFSLVLHCHERMSEVGFLICKYIRLTIMSVLSASSSRRISEWSARKQRTANRIETSKNATTNVTRTLLRFPALRSCVQVHQELQIQDPVVQGRDPVEAHHGNIAVVALRLVPADIGHPSQLRAAASKMLCTLIVLL